MPSNWLFSEMLCKKPGVFYMCYLNIWFLPLVCLHALFPSSAAFTKILQFFQALWHSCWHEAVGAREEMTGKRWWATMVLKFKQRGGKKKSIFDGVQTSQLFSNLARRGRMMQCSCAISWMKWWGINSLSGVVSWVFASYASYSHWWS